MLLAVVATAYLACFAPPSSLHARKIKALLPLECGLLGGVDDE